MMKCDDCGHDMDKILDEAFGAMYECPVCHLTAEINFDKNTHKVDRVHKKEGEGG